MRRWNELLHPLSLSLLSSSCCVDEIRKELRKLLGSLSVLRSQLVELPEDKLSDLLTVSSWDKSRKLHHNPLASASLFIFITVDQQKYYKPPQHTTQAGSVSTYPLHWEHVIMLAFINMERENISFRVRSLLGVFGPCNFKYMSDKTLDGVSTWVSVKWQDILHEIDSYKVCSCGNNQ